LEILFEESMDTFSTRVDHVSKVRVSVNPSLHELLFIGVEPSCFDISDLFDIIGKILPFELLDTLIKCFLIW
jgi:hypothetical protein